MKRSDTSTPSHTNRRALIAHHNSPVLVEPDVVAFLDGTMTDWDDCEILQTKFVTGNEPALLVELLRVSQTQTIYLSVMPIIVGGPHTLPPGILDHVLQHLNELPNVELLEIVGADLTTANCALFQTALQAPGCKVTELKLTNCSFAGAQVVFPNHAPSVTDFTWIQNYIAAPGNNDLTQILPSLAGWPNLKMLELVSGNTPVNFAVLIHLLQIHQGLTSLHLACNSVPLANHASDPQLNPFLLFDAIKRNRTSLVDLFLNLSSVVDPNFINTMMQLLGDCLSVNTTLQSVNMPGIQLCSYGSQQRLVQDLWHNKTLIALEPTAPFGLLSPAPIRRNQYWQYRFSPEFVIGAAEAFMRLMGAPTEIGTQVGLHIVSTSIDRINAAEVMSLLCTTTHANGVRMRSACLRDALLGYIAVGNESSCKQVIAIMAKKHLELLPADKAAVVAQANYRNSTHCLPAGYAG